jgi:hypothetical protein
MVRHSRRDIFQTLAASLSFRSSMPVTGSRPPARPTPNPPGCRGIKTRANAGELRYRAYCLMNVGYLDRYIDAGLHTGFGESQRIADPVELD